MNVQRHVSMFNYWAKLCNSLLANFRLVEDIQSFKLSFCIHNHLINVNKSTEPEYPRPNLIRNIYGRNSLPKVSKTIVQIYFYQITRRN